MTNPVNPAGRRLLRVEARNAQVPIEKKPSWIRTKAVVGDTYKDVRKLVREKKLHTVCAEANCPNVYECWNDREATFTSGLCLAVTTILGLFSLVGSQFIVILDPLAGSGALPSRGVVGWQPR